MRIAHVKISNLLGVETLEFDAGRFNEITGTNGAGKTSVLEAIKAVVPGGHDATLLRAGQERGEVVWVLDDGMEIKKTITAKSSTLTVKKDGVNQPKPQAIISALTDMLSFNPVDFIQARKKDRVDMLLAALPNSAELPRIRTIVGDEAFAPKGQTAMEQIDSAHTAVYDDRTGTNRAIAQKRATITQLEATLPTDDAGAVQEPLADLELRLENLEAANTAEMARIDTKLAGFRAEKDAKLTLVRTERDKEHEAHRVGISSLREQIEELQELIAEEEAGIAKATVACLEAESAAQEGFAEVERKAGLQREKSAARHMEAREPVVASIRAIRSNTAALAAADQTRQTVAVMRQELTDLEADAARQNKALDDLQAYKAELMDGLPIDGLTIDGDGNLFRHGVVFDRLNAAQRVEIAVEIAKLRAGELSVICVDGLEQLDDAHLEQFRAHALAGGFQLFVTRVSNDAFTIQTQE